ncbi:MAG: FHIPEP family type III secretion protein, partial [Rubricella sp.]
EETTFFGSLDGASKFVKGDAIAGLLITLLNLLMGLAMGIIVHGMEAGAAFETYAILTVGDGLVTQIPAVIISIATALLLSKGREQGAADRALIRQLGGYPGALMTVAVLMALFALVPGLPAVPFLIGAICLGAAARIAARPEPEDTQPPALPAEPERKPIGDILDLDDIHVQFAPDLVTVVTDPLTGLDKRIANLREHVAEGFGIVLPDIRLSDDPRLETGRYRIRIQGVEVAADMVRANRVMVLKGEGTDGLPAGEDVEEPVYRAPARWIATEDQEDAIVAGLPVIAPAEVIATHLLETVKQNLGRLMTRRALRKLLDAFVEPSDPARAAANRRLLDEFLPDRVSHETLQAVLRHLLEEQVSIRNLPAILEATAEAGSLGAPDRIVEHVRRRLGPQIVSTLREPDGALPLIQLSADWEDVFTRFETRKDGTQTDIALPPEEFARLVRSISEQVAEASRAGRAPALVAPSHRRRFVSAIMQAKGLRLPVLSFEEIDHTARPTLLGSA